MPGEAGAEGQDPVQECTDLINNRGCVKQFVNGGKKGFTERLMHLAIPWFSLSSFRHLTLLDLMNKWMTTELAAE